MLTKKRWPWLAMTAVALAGVVVTLRPEGSAEAVPSSLTVDDCPSGLINVGDPYYLADAVESRNPEELSEAYVGGTSSTKTKKAKKQQTYKDERRQDFALVSESRRVATLTYEKFDGKGWRLTHVEECG